MKKILVAILVAAMLILPVGISANALFEGCECLGHAHDKCPGVYDVPFGDPDYDVDLANKSCACTYETSEVEDFVLWLQDLFTSRFMEFINLIMEKLGIERA